MFEHAAPTRSSYVWWTVVAVAAHGFAVMVALGATGRAARVVSTPADAPVVMFYKARVPARPRLEPVGGHAAGVAAARARRAPPRVVPAVEATTMTEVVLHDDAQAAERIDDVQSDSDGPGEGSGFGFGAGSGSGFGVGLGGSGAAAAPSAARRAWFVTNDWVCDRPDHEDEAGRVVVRIRVTVSEAGTASDVEIITPGPPVFNARAQSCASRAQYLSALDDAGRPIVGVAEFSIQFLN